MGKRGPKPTPTAVLEARGSWRAKTRRGEPKFEVERLECPEWLGAEAKKHWNDIAGVLFHRGVTTRVDRVALGLLVEAITEYIEAKGVVDQVTDFVAVTDKGNVVHHPAVSVMHNARDAVLRLLREFGMTPSSRSGIQVVGKDGEVIDVGEAFFKSKVVAK